MIAAVRACEPLLSRLTATASLPIAASVVRRRPWASALFIGVRLTVAIATDDDARFDEWLATVPDLDLPLPTHFVADAEVTERSANAATLELLLVEKD